MRIPYGFILASDGVLNINKDEADVISMIFDFYIAGASLGKIVDMLYAKQKFLCNSDTYLSKYFWGSIYDFRISRFSQCKRIRTLQA